MNDEKVKAAIDAYVDSIEQHEWDLHSGSRKELIRISWTESQKARLALCAAIDDLVSRSRTMECAEAAKLAKQTTKEKP